MKKLNPREWLLIIVPLLMMTAALVWQIKPDVAKNIQNSLQPPSIFYVESISFAPLAPSEVADGYDKKVEVVLNHKGPQPVWWNKQNGAAGGYNKGDKLVLRGDSKQRSQHCPPTVQAPFYDSKRQRYVASYLLDLTRLAPSQDDIVLHANLAVGMKEPTPAVSPVVPIRFVVRRGGQIVKTPHVSRKPGLVVERVLVQSIPPAERGNAGCDTLVRVVFKRKPDDYISQNASTNAGYVLLTDETGRELSTNAVGPSLEDAFERSYARIPTTRLDERYFCDYRFAFPKNKPQRITMKNKVSLRGAWPLEYSATVYDAKRPRNFGTKEEPNSVAFTQRAAPLRR
jgi:hypothetical protein